MGLHLIDGIPAFLREHIPRTTGSPQLLDLIRRFELLDHSGEGDSLHAQELGDGVAAEAFRWRGGEYEQGLAGRLRIQG
ncbi:MAG: hypothetical protein ACK6AD_07225 [Cyanobacteriota bacterium]|jgi:hypothetical protein